MKEVVHYRENVDLVRLGEREIYLVGTAHVSRASADLAEQVIREVEPDTVAVELCEPRYRSLKDPDRWKNTDILEVIRSGKAYLLLVQMMLASFQKRVGEKLGVKPGEEMLRALAVAEEVGADTVLADRDVRTTLRRTWARLGLFTAVKVLAALLASQFEGGELDEEEIERLKTSDVLEETMREFSEELPEVRACLIDERDRYLAAKIGGCSGKRVVAVVGAGHVPGVLSCLGETIDTEALEVVPPPSRTGRVLKWVIPVVILGLMIYGIIHSGTATGAAMFYDWFVINAVAGGLGAAAALAHPLTILVAFLVSPFTSLNPTIAAGWVAGLVEAWLRKPRVADFESLGEDLTAVSGIWRNRVSRILLVVVLTNLLGTIGTFIGGGVVAAHLH